MTSIIFLLSLIALLLVALTISKDLLSPTCILCMVFAFSTICAIYNTNNWAFSMTAEAQRLLLTGLCSFVVVAGIVRFFSTRRIENYVIETDDGSKAELNPITISVAQSYVIALSFILATAFYYFMIRSVVGSFAKFSDIAYVYRRGNNDGEMELPFIARLAWNVLRGLSIVTIYVIVRNATTGKLFQNHGLLLIACVGIYAFAGLISGERASAMRLVALAVIFWGVCWKKAHPSHANISFKTLLIGVIGLVVVLYAFSAIRFFVGRTLDLTPIDYITYYAGVPIYNFSYATGQHMSPTMDGAMTFLGIRNNLVRVFGGQITSVHRLYVVNPVNNLSMGNVYTFLYDYYHDFGVIGIIVLTAIYSALINGLYTTAIYRMRESAWLSCIYAFVGTTLFFASFTEQFFSTYIAFTSIEIIVTLWLGFRVFDIDSSAERLQNTKRNGNVHAYTRYSY